MISFSTCSTVSPTLLGSQLQGHASVSVLLLAAQPLPLEHLLHDGDIGRDVQCLIPEQGVQLPVKSLGDGSIICSTFFLVASIFSPEMPAASIRS